MYFLKIFYFLQKQIKHTKVKTAQETISCTLSNHIGIKPSLQNVTLFGNKSCDRPSFRWLHRRAEWPLIQHEDVLIEVGTWQTKTMEEHNVNRWHGSGWRVPPPGNCKTCNKLPADRAEPTAPQPSEGTSCAGIVTLDFQPAQWQSINLCASSFSFCSTCHRSRQRHRHSSTQHKHHCCLHSFPVPPTPSFHSTLYFSFMAAIFTCDYTHFDLL